ncbi:hypothetical protein F5Y19DRAFT_453982 [Xylariaceae sp. FL1651]|nr:hypothetical protein F5Y19DRAFT_453982 [Xylariaceae sp. FL1651]
MPREISVLETRHRLIVGLDFGTTFTGISFAMTTESLMVHPIDKWPAMDGSSITARKTPTQIAYNQGLTSRPWGYQVKHGCKNSYAWMKYHLDSAAAPSEFDDPLLAEEMQQGIFHISGVRTAEQITVDYLTEVLRFTVEHIGQELGENILRVTSISFWLTRPALWGFQAQQKLKKAVETAAKEAKFPGTRDLDEFGLIAEPEAAAFAIIVDGDDGIDGEGDDIDDGIKKGTVVMVCDCGGGTVDITVHLVKEIFPVVKLDEVVPSQGAKCGAAYIDRLFDDFMKRKFGSAYENVELEERSPNSTFKRDFEHNKHRFGTDEPLVNMKLRMPDVDPSNKMLAESYSSRDGEVILTEAEMKEIFDPAVEKILGLLTLQQQAVSEKRIKHMDLILVGGLGGSPYLQSLVATWCLKRRIRLRNVKSEYSWGAVAQGAVLHGLGRADVEKRLARFHIGVVCALPYDPELDSPDEAQYNYLVDEDMVDNCIAWTCRAGTEITATPTGDSFFRELLKGESGFSIDIVSCAAEDPPRKKNSKEIEVVGKLNVRLRKVDVKKYEIQTRWGRKIKFNFRVEQIFGNKQGTLLIRVTADGMALGKQEINFQ